MTSNCKDVSNSHSNLYADSADGVISRTDGTDLLLISGGGGGQLLYLKPVDKLRL